MKRVLEFLAARFLFLTLEVTPPGVAQFLARCYGRLLDLCAPRLRRTAARNLTLVMPELNSDRLASGVFRNVGRVLLAMARFPSLNKQNIHSWIEYEGFEHYSKAKAQGRGVLIATAHLGNWELSAFAHALMTEPMHVVVRPLDNPLLDRFVERRRSLSGNRIIEKKKAARDILRALRANEAVGVLIDQNTSLEEGVFVPFFGINACTGTAFARLAHRSGAAVLLGYAVWQQARGKYQLRFEPVPHLTGDAEQDTARIHAQLESAIRAYPDQWLWIHRRWKTRPHGEPTVY